MDETKQPEKQRRWSNVDWLSASSFFGAAVLGLFSIANNIRHHFYNAIIEGFGENATPFTPTVEKYIGTHGLPWKRGSGDSIRGIFAENSDKYVSGEFSATKWAAENRQAAIDFRKEIATQLEKELNIPTSGLKGWTVGTVKRWREMGEHARFDSSLGFATVAAIAIGAISLLRHDKHTLDRIEEKLDSKESQR